MWKFYVILFADLCVGQLAKRITRETRKKSFVTHYMAATDNFKLITIGIAIINFKLLKNLSLNLMEAAVST